MKTTQLLRNGMRLAALIVFLSVIGCKDSSNTTTTVVDANGLSGDLKGAVVFYDSTGIPMANGSGALVELVGTSFSAITDSTGLWVMHTVPTRNYSLRFSKAGFTTYYGSLAYLGGGTMWFYNPAEPLKLAQPPTFTVTIDAVLIPDKVYVDTLGTAHYPQGHLYAHFSKNTPANATVFGMEIIVGTTADLDLHKPDSYIGSVTSSGYYKYDADSTVNVDYGFYSDIYGFLRGIPAGTTVYFKAYPFIGYDIRYYYTPDTYEKIYIDYGAGSNVLSGVVK